MGLYVAINTRIGERDGGGGGGHPFVHGADQAEVKARSNTNDLHVV